MNQSFIARYGAKRGFILTNAYRVAYKTGFCRSNAVNWDQVERLVFVCKGNVCRSAFAEAVAKSLGFETISGGIGAIEDDTANDQAIATARKLGFNLELHSTTPIMYPVYTKHDLLLSMEPWQDAFLDRHLFGTYQHSLLGLWTNPIRPYIHDPYGLAPEYFESCFKYIEHAINAVITKIKQNH